MGLLSANEQVCLAQCRRNIAQAFFEPQWPSIAKGVGAKALATMWLPTDIARDCALAIATFLAKMACGGRKRWISGHAWC
jgi:hypothetical protein